jgi:hypothetical protein
MRAIRFAFIIFVLFFISPFAAAQQTTISSPQPLLLLQQSLSALSVGQSLTDATLSGTARRIAGSDDDTGTAIFKALASGAGRVDFNLSSGQRSEFCDLSSAAPAGAWSGPDRISHPIAFHNLLSEPAWFFPAFAIARRLSSPGYIATYVGHEIHNGQAVEHVSVSQTSSSQDSPGAPTFQHLTQIDFFLDSSTLLPAAITFNIHPDNDAGVDLPVEIRFSEYRFVIGSHVPYHIQKYMNNNLFLDFQVQSVSLNAGLSSTIFALQPS